VEFNSPLSDERAMRLITLLELTSQHNLLDVGCGTGSFLLAATKQSGAIGLGIDIDESLVSKAKKNALANQSSDNVEFQAADIRALELPNFTFDCAICLGSSHAFGLGEQAFPNALTQLNNLVKPGGKILLGEGYWKQTPDTDYLALIGEPLGIYNSHRQNIASAVSFGLTPIHASTSTDDEWDNFEWAFRTRAERNAAENPQDAAAAKKLAHARKWNEAYLRWGRDTMGFGYYLFQSHSGA